MPPSRDGETLHCISRSNIGGGLVPPRNPGHLQPFHRIFRPTSANTFPTKDDKEKDVEIPAYARSFIEIDLCYKFPPVKPINQLPFDTQAVNTVRKNWFTKRASQQQKGILDLVWKPDAFRAALQDSPQLFPPMPRSTLSFKQLRQLISIGYFRVFKGVIKAVASFFLVRKKNDTARPISNPKINQLFKLPSKMHLIQPKQLLDKVFRARCFIPADLRSWFSQIWIHPLISPYFVSRIYTVSVALAVLGQGFKASPFVAEMPFL